MIKYYKKSVGYLNNFGIEVGVAVGNATFILPDSGLVIMDDARRVQPSQGVGLVGATYAGMPLGPRHLLAFTSKTRGVKYTDLDDSQVVTANANLQHAAIRAYFRHL